MALEYIESLFVNVKIFNRLLADGYINKRGEYRGKDGRTLFVKIPKSVVKNKKKV